MFILVLIIVGGGNAMQKIDQPFDYREQCETAGEVFKAGNHAKSSRSYDYVCIPLKPLKED